jgi:subtilisin family serine protease
MDHPEIRDLFLTDDTEQIAVYYDFVDMRDCLADDVMCTPDTPHGMGVFGIIAARTNNETPTSESVETPLKLNIAGIAPNTHQIVIKRPLVDSAMYKDVLLWIAGLQPSTEGLSSGWPAEPIIHRADIINCSHEVKNLPLSGLMDDTLRVLTVAGREKRGTVIIYSAGNDDTCITGTETWAAHFSAIAISNTNEPDPVDEIESRNLKSNWGREVDLCARGDNVWSLNDSGFAAPFWGSSAAAPTVAAAAALILSITPHLSWSQVRKILCDSAEMIDPLQEDEDGQWSPEPNSFSNYYGHGRLDVLEAVKRAWELRS